MSYNIVFTKDKTLCGKVVIENDILTVYSCDEISQEDFDLLKALENYEQ